MSANAGGHRGGRIRVAVLFGGQSAEHDVSLRSAETVIGALDPERYDVVKIGVTREGRWLTGGDPLRQLEASSPLFSLGDGGDGVATADQTTIETAPSALPAGLDGEIDVVFPVLHGPMGEDGTVQGMLELAGLPYVGSGVLGSALAMDKAMAKTVLAQAGLPQVPWRLIERREWQRDPGHVTEWVADRFGFPVFVKPANMGSSVGVFKARDAGELPAAMTGAARFDRRLVIEQGIDARELECAVLGNDEPIASVVGEIVPGREFYDYEAKYVDDRSRSIIPAELDGEELVYVQELAITSFQALDLAGMARVDFFLDRRTDQIYVNEVNTIPGFTAISMYPMLWEATGLPTPELVDRLIGLALGRFGERQRSA